MIYTLKFMHQSPKTTTTERKKVILVAGICCLLSAVVGATVGVHFLKPRMAFVITMGKSMVPTLPDGAIYQSVLPKHLERGDIVTVNDDEGVQLKNAPVKTESIVKRIIGLPGETLTITNGQVYLNGKLLNEPYLVKGTITKTLSWGNEIKAGKDEFIILGDNRAVSCDSRAFGPINVAQITSKLDIYTLAPKIQQ